MNSRRPRGMRQLPRAHHTCGSEGAAPEMPRYHKGRKAAEGSVADSDGGGQVVKPEPQGHRMMTWEAQQGSPLPRRAVMALTSRSRPRVLLQRPPAAFAVAPARRPTCRLRCYTPAPPSPLPSFAVTTCAAVTTCHPFAVTTCAAVTTCHHSLLPPAPPSPPAVLRCYHLRRRHHLPIIRCYPPAPPSPPAVLRCCHPAPPSPPCRLRCYHLRRRHHLPSALRRCHHLPSFAVATCAAVTTCRPRLYHPPCAVRHHLPSSLLPPGRRQPPCRPSLFHLRLRHHLLSFAVTQPAPPSPPAVLRCYHLAPRANHLPSSRCYHLRRRHHLPSFAVTTCAAVTTYRPSLLPPAPPSATYRLSAEQPAYPSLSSSDRASCQHRMTTPPYAI
ncbi:hypothetical protein C7M84_014384 [Penaeus vannamei]|uniref:Uncharacterized protein n=1 Tax=Penaeus vannamei TaxID=6689 RepID=A0A3R7PIC4_PENVA|nr:hypothetical protein C7M84_014384 [Penaeus vannamei]